MGTEDSWFCSTPEAWYLTPVLQQQQLLGAGCTKQHLVAPPGFPWDQVRKEWRGLHHVCPLQNRHQWQPLVQHIHGELGQEFWLRQDTAQHTVTATLCWKILVPRRHLETQLCSVSSPAPGCGGTHLGGDKVL